MIRPEHIEQAIRSAVQGGSFLASRLERENPELLYVAGLTNFINALLLHDPSVRLRDVKSALLTYAQQRARPM